jgi:hypothetical protein
MSGLMDDGLIKVISPYDKQNNVIVLTWIFVFLQPGLRNPVV